MYESHQSDPYKKYIYILRYIKFCSNYNTALSYPSMFNTLNPKFIVMVKQKSLKMCVINCIHRDTHCIAVTHFKEVLHYAHEITR